MRQRKTALIILLKKILNNLKLNNEKSAVENFMVLTANRRQKKYHFLVSRVLLVKGLQFENVVIVEPDFSKISPYLLRYFFELPYVHKQIKGDVGGSVQGVINTKQISDLIIPTLL